MDNQKFKATPLGYMPNDWDVKTVVDLCEILDSKRVPLNKQQREKMNGDIPYFGANGILDYVNDYLFDQPLILMAEDGGYFTQYQTRPIAYKVEGKSWVNNHAHVLSPKRYQNINWIYYNLVHKNILPFINGGTRGKLNQKDLKGLPIPYPPQKEQQKIAAILSSVDEAIEKTEQIITQTEKVKKGLMQQLLTKGIGHTKFKKTTIGEIPEEWEISLLKDLSYKITDGAHKTPKYTEKGIPFLRVTDLKNNHIDFDSTKYISEEEHNNLIKRCHPEKGDILISKNGTIGLTRVVDWDEEFSIFVSLALIKLKKDRVNPKFIEYFLQSSVAWHQIRLRSKQGTVTNLHLVEIKELVCGIPSLEEQNEIVNKIDKVNSKLEIESKKVDKLIKLKSGLMQQLLTGKVRVPVDENEVMET